ncbi:MAG: dual specificity protein phosphatase family protein [Nitrospira sp.]|nr:dual specificity protein phosphatase family protein [Nitrospira sp.]
MLLFAEPMDYPGIASLYLKFEDGCPLGGDLLTRGLEFVSRQKQAGRSVLIACGAGQSRSVVFAIAALKQEEGLSIIDAFRTISDQHPEAQPHMVLWESLCKHYGEDVSYFTMLKALESKG